MVSLGSLLVNGPKWGATTVVHNFTAQATKGGSTVPLTVEVIPVKGMYRIYFRAINDYQKSDSDDFGAVPAEDYGAGPGTSNNWIDCWNSGNRTSTAHEDSHRLYAYTQYGQSANDNPVWRYTTGFDSDDKAKFDYKNNGTTVISSNNRMKADNNNRGWYYYDIPVKCEGDYDTGLQTNETKPGTDLYNKYGYGPLPGATLLIFFNNEGSNTRHRVNQNDEPGIPLGDDADLETWVLFDPSRDPVFNVYNDKPRIENVTYTIYSDIELFTWRIEYGLHNIHG